MISSARNALTEAVGRQLAEAAHTAADSLARTLARERGELGTFARQDLMREIRIGDLDKRIAAFLLNLKNAKDSLLELRIDDAQGQTIAATAPRPDAASGRPAPIGSDAASGLNGPLRLPDGTQALEISVAIPDPDHGARPLGRLTAQGGDDPARRRRRDPRADSDQLKDDLVCSVVLSMRQVCGRDAMIGAATRSRGARVRSYRRSL